MQPIFFYMSFDFLTAKYLCVTSSALLIPFSFYMNNAVKNFCEFPDDKKNDLLVYETVLAVILFIAIYASQWFWSNPIRHGIAHKVDAIVAKITILAFFVYTNFYKELWRDWVYIGSTMVLLFFATMSYIESSNEWCSSSHVFYHGGLHLIAAFLGVYAFT